MLGLVNGQSGARRWRRMLSDPALLAANDPALIYDAWRSQRHVPPERDGASLTAAPASA